MSILKATLVTTFLLTISASAQAGYYIGEGQCKEGDKLVHQRECRAAGVTGPSNGIAVAVCCKSADAVNSNEAQEHEDSE